MPARNYSLFIPLHAHIDSTPMPTLQELHAVHLSRLQVTIKESELLLQREGGLDGELRTSGFICEQFVRTTLQRFVVPGQFRLTTGFVATPALLRSRSNLPQCDILIVDRDSLPLLRFDDSGIEVVPREAVCGIIEVKRSLTASSLQGDAGALAHINEIIGVLGESEELKTDRILNRANRHVGFHNYSSNKPLLGVIALRNNIEPFTEVATLATTSKSLVDFVWTIDGNAMLPGFVDGDRLQYYSHTARPRTCTWRELTSEDFSAAESQYYRAFQGTPMWNCIGAVSNSSPAKVFSTIIGVLSLTLSRVCATPMKESQIEQYYLQ